MPKPTPPIEKKLVRSIYESDHASPGLLFWRAFFNWQKQIRAALEPHDLTQGQYAILAAITFLSSDKSAVNQQDVAHQLAMDKMMVSDLVKTTTQKRFITKKPHPKDSRAYALALTAAGRKVLKTCVPIVEAADEKFFRGAGNAYAGLEKGLKRLAVIQPESIQ